MTITIDLTDPGTRQVLALAALCWGIALALVIYNIASDLLSKRRERPRAERRYIEPCAPDLHDYADDDVCRNCKTARPLEPPAST